MRPNSTAKHTVTQQQPDNHWSQIPDWLVGDWKEKSIVQTYSKDLTTGKVDTKSKTITDTPEQIFQPRRGRLFYPTLWFGTQKDSKGQYWQFEGSPMLWVVNDDLNDQVAAWKESDKFDAVNSKIVERRFVLNTLRFYNPTVNNGTIKSVDRCEYVTTYSPVKDGVVNVVSCLTTFNEDGQPISESKTRGQIWRLQDNWKLQVYPYWEVPADMHLDPLDTRLSKYLAEKNINK
jgi:hypothetical protein